MGDIDSDPSVFTLSTPQKVIGGSLVTLLLLGVVTAWATAPNPSGTAPSIPASTTSQLNAQPQTTQGAPAPAPAADTATKVKTASDESGATTSGDPIKADRVLTDKDNGRVIRVAVGSTVAIRLKENRTTGYGWGLESKTDPTIKGAASVSSHLTLELDKSLRSAGRLIGAPGEHVFVFRAASTGTAEVFAAYRRPWLPVATTPPGQTYDITIEIHGHDRS